MRGVRGVGAVRNMGLGAWIAAAVALLAVVSAGRGRSAAAPPPPRTLVRTAEVRQTAVEDSSEYVATIESLSSTLIKPEVTGELRAVLVTPGDRVQASTPLFQIDPARQQATVSSQDAARAAQVAATTFAKQQLDRARTLFKAGASSQQDLEQAQANYDAAVSQSTALDARLQQERVTLSYYSVRSPSTGTVGDIPVRVGMHVTSDTVLTTIDRNQDLEIDVHVPLERSADLKIGLPIELIGAGGTTLARTTIFFVSPQVDDQTRAVLVKGKVPADVGLRSAQYMRARIIWRTQQGLTLRTALQWSAGGGRGRHPTADGQRAHRLPGLDGRAEAVVGAFPAGHEVPAGLRQHHHRDGVDPRGADHAPRGHRPGRARDVPFPAGLAPTPILEHASYSARRDAANPALDAKRGGNSSAPPECVGPRR